MKKIVLHPVSELQLTTFSNHPGHFLIVTGPKGIGKKTIANMILSRVLKFKDQELAKLVNVHFVRPDKNSISIDQVRDFKHFLKLKTQGVETFRRAVIIEEAQLLTQEAQNALLKTLEEPPQDTMIIILVDRVESLEETIISRGQIIEIKRPKKGDTMAFFEAESKDHEVVEQAYRLSDGLPGLMTSILDKTKPHSLLESVNSAKTILKKNKLDRLMLVQDLAKEKDKVSDIVRALIRISSASLDQSLKLGNASGSKQWENILKESITADQALMNNANSRLVLANLFMNI